MIDSDEHKTMLMAAGCSDAQATAQFNLMTDKRREFGIELIRALNAVPDSEFTNSVSYTRERLHKLIVKLYKGEI